MSELEFDKHIKMLIEAEKRINQIQQEAFFKLYNKDGSDRVTSTSSINSSIDISSKVVEGEIGTGQINIPFETLKWVVTKPKDKKAKDYELCDEKYEQVYIKLRDYIIENRQGYNDVKLNGYTFRILKNGIMRRKV